MYYVPFGFERLCVSFFILGVFFFLICIYWLFRDKIHWLCIMVYALFIYHIYTVFVLKNIKNRSYSIIYIFINYFVTMFLIFSFQFQQ